MTSSKVTLPPSARATPMRVVGHAAAVGGAAGVEDLEALGVGLVQRDVRVAEDHRVRVGEALAHPGETIVGGTAVVGHGDLRALGVDQPRRGQQRLQLCGVGVAVDRLDRRSDGLQLLEHRALHQVTRVEDQIGGAHALERGLRQRAVAARQVGVGDDRDEHGPREYAARPAISWPAQAPVAQWIERPPPEREVAGSNPAGRAPAARRLRQGALRRDTNGLRQRARSRCSAGSVVVRPESGKISDPGCATRTQPPEIARTALTAGLHGMMVHRVFPLALVA